MQFKIPKNTEKYFWTQHATFKLRQYGLSAQRVIRVINNPQRKEDGIVPRTVAVMQPTSISTRNGKRVWSSEIWAMYQISATGGKMQSAFGNLISNNIKNNRLKIISVWRYPGVSPQNNPIPEEILREIEELSQ